jgi:hypothetical protein
VVAPGFQDKCKTRASHMRPSMYDLKPQSLS